MSRVTKDGRRALLGALVTATLGLVAVPAAQAAVTIGPATQTVPENGTLSFQLSRDAVLFGSDAEVTVTLGGPGDTAGCPDDVAADGQACSVTVPVTAGDAFSQTPGTGTASFAINPDELVEGDETISAHVTAVDSDTFDSSLYATATITDYVAPTVSVGPASVTEGTSSTPTPLGIPVALSAASTRDVTVDYDLSAGTATADDVGLDSGSVTIPAGDTTADIPASVVADAIDEDDETFTATLSGPSNATLGTASATETIIDDDGPPTVSVGAASVREGTGSAATPFSIPITLSKPAVQDVKVGFDLSAGSATTADVALATGTVTVPAGQTTASISAPVVADAIDEDDETFTATLSSPSNATVGTASATETIVDDDTAQLAVSDVVAAEGSGGSTLFLFTAGLTTPSSRTVSVDYATQDGAATAPGDYATARGTVQFAPGVQSQRIRVSVVGDTVPEKDEAFAVRLSGAVGASIVKDTGFGVIVNDDGVVPVKSTNSSTDKTPPKVKLGRLTLRKPRTVRSVVTCPATETRCKAKVTLFTVAARRSKVKALRTELELATKTITIAGGKHATVSLRLSANGLKLLRRAKRTSATAYAVVTDRAGNVGTAQVSGVLRP